MKLIKAILNPFNGAGRFNRYYGNLIQAGEGYPTADEAKADMRRQELSKSMIGWMR
ncbi:MAG: hypothetical protein R2845_16555 [Thermomicrobiales bacterium]